MPEGSKHNQQCPNPGTKNSTSCTGWRAARVEARQALRSGTGAGGAGLGTPAGPSAPRSCPEGELGSSRAVGTGATVCPALQKHEPVTQSRHRGTTRRLTKPTAAPERHSSPTLGPSGMSRKNPGQTRGHSWGPQHSEARLSRAASVKPQQVLLAFT